jgi:pimeloyl-ACP methyl ester carboxylesterase
MKAYKRFIIIGILLVVLMLSACIGKPLPESGLVNFEAEDGLTIYADLYRIKDNNASYIILFHQAGSSRGEYLEIAPRLNEMGFNCLAVDQRSGSGMNDVKNMTVYTSKEFGYGYTDAYPDLKAALSYVKKELRAKKIIIWGSSYSSALVFVLASEFPEDVHAVLAFSPGEYFEVDGKKIGDCATSIKCPVFITSEAWGDFNGTSFANLAKSLYDRIPSANKVFFMPEGIPGQHGSSTLWRNHVDSELYWEQVTKFLESL